SEPSGSTELYFEGPMTAEPEELDVTRDVEDQSEKPTVVVSEEMERSVPVEATAEDELAVPGKKGDKKREKGSRPSSKATSGTVTPRERLEHVPEPRTRSLETLDQQIEEQSTNDHLQESKDSSIKDAVVTVISMGAAGVVAASIGRDKDQQ